MMGRQHALGGTAAWLATAPLLHQSPAQVALGCLVAAGGAMAPDLDQRNSTIGRTYGPITNVLARGIGAVAGGHRNGTHSIVGVAALTGWASVAFLLGGLTQGILVWILLGVGCRAYGIAIPGHRSLTAVIHALSMGLLTLVVLGAGLDLSTVLVWGMFLGAASHVILDMLTPQRCPLLWPFARRRFGVGLVTTGSRWTSPLVTLSLVALNGALIALS